MIRVILADDHNIVREGLVALIDRQEDMEVVGQADNGLDIVRMSMEKEPDVVVMDVTMPDLNGIEATKHILRDRPGTKVLALSMHSDRRFVSKMLSAGAAGYMLKDCAFDELAHAIRTVYERKTYLSGKVVEVVLDDYVNRLETQEETAAELLSNREREVLQLLAEGNSTKEIADRLHLSVKTIETHRRSIMEKLNLRSVAELTKYAVREGLTSLES